MHCRILTKPSRFRIHESCGYNGQKTLSVFSENLICDSAPVDNAHLTLLRQQISMQAPSVLPDVSGFLVGLVSLVAAAEASLKHADAAQVRQRH